jgi:transposase-like protein
MHKNVVAQIRKATRRKYSAEEKIRIVLEGLRGEIPISGLFRREGIAPTMCYRWSKTFLEAGKNRGLSIITNRGYSCGSPLHLEKRRGLVHFIASRQEKGTEGLRCRAQKSVDTQAKK